MALAPTSEEVKEPPPALKEEEEEAAAAAEPPEEDLEDGEIEDDDDEVPPEAPTPQPPPPAAEASQPSTPKSSDKHKERSSDEKERSPASAKHKKKHLTEAEKSVLKLHKKERLEREKREKYRREQLHPQANMEPVDDYAVSLEKALAKVLRKDKTVSEDEKEEEVVPKRGKKRKRKDKHKKNKKGRLESPMNADDENERPNMDQDAQHKSEGESTDTESSSDKGEMRKRHANREKRENAKNRNRDRRDRSRERNNGGSFKKLRKRNVGICLYYLQGKCSDEHCPYSHDCVQPLKLELCKFYLQDCCAKGDKCLYMHSDFPCKYYHTGIPCPFADDCKFAHGGPLPESVKQILFKHIETAPKEILGNFPRLSRENAHMMITQAQKNLEMRMGKAKEETSGKKDDSRFDFQYNDNQDNQDQVSDSDGQKGDKKEKRNRPSRWQDPEPEATADAIKGILSGFGLKGNFQDQDMRINSNGDVDMRALTSMQHQSIHPTDIVNPNIFTTKPPPILPSNLQNLQSLQNINLQQLLQPTVTSFGLINPSILSQSGLVSTAQTFLSSQDQMKSISSTSVDIEQYKLDAAQAAKPPKTEDKDVDLRKESNNQSQGDSDNRLSGNSQNFDTPDDEDALQIVMDEEEPAKQESPTKQDPSEPSFALAKTQRDLFQRIQQQQRINTPQTDAQNDQEQEQQDQNIDWYSDDEDDNKLTIEHDDQEENADAKSEQKTDSPAEPLEPAAVVEKLGDLSTIDIPAQVSQLLSTMQRNSKPTDPRTKPSDPRESRESRDPRLARLGSTEDAPKPEPMTIYEQSTKDIDLRNDRQGRSDVDLRSLSMPFKSLGNYTPASEIDASINSHPALTWRVYIVDIPKPDYTGLKLSATDAQTSGDPRLRKIFRLSTEEKDSPASPGASPKAAAAPAPRIDPRRKKAMEQQAAAEKDQQPLTYAQQLATLQQSPFYQSLTSNQKVMLNQELESRNDQSGMSDPIISAMLSNLGLQNAQQTQHTAQQAGQAINILSNLTGFTPGGGLMSNAPPNMGQGLLGPAPTHLQDFPLNFDPRNGAGLLGSGPTVFGGQDFGALQQPPPNVNAGFNDDFYDQQGGGGLGGNFAPNQRPDGGNRFNNNNAGNQNRDRNNRRGRNNNNNRNRNNYFRRQQQQHNNNRNRNSPS